MRGIGGILIVLLTSSYGYTQSNQCLSIFLDTTVVASDFAFRLSDLNQKISSIKPQNRKDLLFSIIKKSKVGSELLAQMDSKVKIEFREIEGLGFFENRDISEDRIVLNKNLKLGTAAAILVHELTHARDYIVDKLADKNLSYSQKTLQTEYNAYLNEKIFTHEMSKYSEYQDYIRHVNHDKTNNLLSHHMDSELFAQLMLTAEGIDWARTRQFLKTVSNPNFLLRN